MALIEWTDDLKVGIKQIDQQHFYLIQIINDFYINLRKDPTNDLLHEILQKMKNYSFFHFDTEEKLLAKFKYTDIESHISEHNDFIRKIKEIEGRLKRDHLVVTYEMISYLKDWINSHIKVSDKAYVSFLNENGIAG